MMSPVERLAQPQLQLQAQVPMAERPLQAASIRAAARRLCLDRPVASTSLPAAAPQAVEESVRVRLRRLP
jgi:hypothetical protein